MKTMRIRSLLGGIILLSAFVNNAYALPSFARQTGMSCTACHTVFPELTQMGRDFKMRGYTMTGGETKMPLPVSAMLLVDMTKSSDNTDLAKDGAIVIPQVSLFYGGKITDKSGAFIQLTYDGTELPDKADVAHHIGMDNMDIRYADSATVADKELIYGVTINNGPTISDLWNSTSAWGFPYASSAVANAPTQATMVDGGLAQAVGGIGAYGMWNDLVYAEIAAYQSARPGGPMTIFGWKNQDLKGDDASVVKGTATYGRLVLQHTYANSYIMVGGYALNSIINPGVVSNTTGQYDTYRDRAIDAQYQYTNGSHMITAMATKIWEKQTLDGSEAQGLADNMSNDLTTTRAKVSYYYDQKYGVSLGYFSTSGTADVTKYETLNGSPNSKGQIAEIDYLPMQNIKLALQYTRYDKFDGARKNYDGVRNASDNNNLYLLGWFMF